MYFYKFGYNSCEESHFWEFSHAQKFSEKELKDFVFGVLWEIYVLKHRAEIYKDIIEVEKKFEAVSLWEILHDESNKKQIFVEKMKKLGFKPIQYEPTVIVFGWASTKEGSWSGYAGPTTNEIQQYFSRKKKEYKAKHPRRNHVKYAK